MFDFDKYLKDLTLKDVSPSDDLIERTLLQCKGEMNKNRSKTTHKGGFLMNKTTYKRVGLVATPILAVLVIGVFLATNFFGTKLNSVQTYYTVDINPSVCIGVDKNGVVIEIVSQNDDAVNLIKNLDVKGESAELAIGKIIDTAKDAGYIKDTDKYVLVGHFGKENQEFLRLQESLQKKYGDTVKLLIVSGTLEDKKEADALAVSAGMLKLSEAAQGVNVKNQDKVEDVVGNVNKKVKSNLEAPKLQAKVAGKSGVKFSWNKLDLKSIGYVGKATYQIVVGDSEEQVLQMNGEVVKTMSFYSYGRQPMQYNLKSANIQVSADTTKYFAIYAKFDGSEEVMCSNVVKCELSKSSIPSNNPSASTKKPNAPSKDTSGESSQASRNPTAPSNKFSDISGRLSGNAINLNWDKANFNGFKSYRVIYSFSNSNPAYLKSDCHVAMTISDVNQTSCSIDVTTLVGYTPGATCYFSVDAVYKSNAIKVAGNSVGIKIPSTSIPNSPISDVNVDGQFRFSKMGQN